MPFQSLSPLDFPTFLISLDIYLPYKTCPEYKAQTPNHTAFPAVPWRYPALPITHANPSKYLLHPFTTQLSPTTAKHNPFPKLPHRRHHQNVPQSSSVAENMVFSCPLPSAISFNIGPYTLHSAVKNGRTFSSKWAFLMYLQDAIQFQNRRAKVCFFLPSLPKLYSEIFV